MTCKLAALVLLALTTAGAPRAPLLYLSLDPPRATAGEEVRVSWIGGAPFAGQATAAESQRLHRLWNSGRAALDDASGAATFRTAAPGVELIAGLPHGPEGDAGAVSSFAKTLLVVGEPTTSGRVWRSELGHKLEIVPRTDPLALARDGGVLEVQVLFDREPLPRATVVAVAEDGGAAHPRQGKTDELGHVRLELDRPGRWLVHLEHKSFSQVGDRGWTLYQSSLLVTVGP